MKKLLFTSVIVTSLISCTKIGGGEVCYVCIDDSGNAIGEPCGETKAIARKKIVGTYNGVDYSNMSAADFDRFCKKK